MATNHEDPAPIYMEYPTDHKINPVEGPLPAPAPAPLQAEQQPTSKEGISSAAPNATNGPYMQQPQPYAEGAQVNPTYQNATPLDKLGEQPAPVDCPTCGVRQLTRTEYHSGNTTLAWAAGLFCICCPAGAIPFCMDNTKDVDHFCGNEGTKLATWHRSGRTEVFVHPTKVA
ncbi:hypothetical protein MMC25_006624 [Agyrium rufum]|nr:hypothetical protein [Agyrium rufum]